MWVQELEMDMNSAMFQLEQKRVGVAISKKIVVGLESLRVVCLRPIFPHVVFAITATTPVVSPALLGILRVYHLV